MGRWDTGPQAPGQAPAAPVPNEVANWVLQRLYLSPPTGKTGRSYLTRPPLPVFPSAVSPPFRQRGGWVRAAAGSWFGPLPDALVRMWNDEELLGRYIQPTEFTDEQLFEGIGLPSDTAAEPWRAMQGTTHFEMQGGPFDSARDESSDGSSSEAPGPPQAEPMLSSRRADEPPPAAEDEVEPGGVGEEDEDPYERRQRQVVRVLQSGSAKAIERVLKLSNGMALSELWEKFSTADTSGQRGGAAASVPLPPPRRSPRMRGRPVLAVSAEFRVLGRWVWGDAGL